MKVCAYLLGASALAFAWCGTATAQTAPTSQPGNGTPSDSQSSDTPPDIIVTAQRRSENLMTTAVSASVLSGTDLANKGVVNVDALQFAMPSVTVNNFGQGNDFNVRGIGKAEHNTQTTTGVITYRDGVPTFPGYVQGEPYYDVANIQVLRGPQGTIVGQNATGGAVFVNTNDPIINGGVHGYFNANYGNYNDAGAQGAVNLPISDTFAARIALYGERRDGFYNVTGPTGAQYNAANNKLGIAAGRLSLLWKPSENFSVLSKTDLGYLDFGAYPATPYWQTFKTLPNGTANPRYSDLFNITANAPQAARDKFVRSILRLEYRTDGGVKFRSVSGLQTANTMYRADLDGTSSNFPNPITGVTTDSTFFDSVTETQFSQEFNVISPDNQRFTWLIGGFGLWNTYVFPQPYDNFTIDVCNPLNLAACKYQLKGRNPERSLAVFGQIGFNLTDNVKVELGGRYTASRTTNHVDVLQYGTYIRDDQTATSDNFSYKASIGWKVSPSQYLYAFVATGFRPGGLNVPVGLGLPAPFEPETITSYEAGWKGNFAGGKVRTTLTGFYNDYKNFQVIIGYPTFPTFGIELNVPGKTKIYGFEGEIEFHSGGFSFDAGINVLHSELGGPFYASDSRVATTVPCDPHTGPVSTSCINLTGRQQTYAPNFTFNVGAQYTFSVGEKDKIIPRVNFGHVGAQWATLFEAVARGDRLSDRNILNAQLAWEHGSWTVTGYATNLTNQHYAGALNSGLYFAGPPRQYGVKVLKTF
ncbi:MAG TPA: TonB-dependent receptor [Sphingomonas sp.]|nr:TonB-dependent receptor [Sphingomonas sp.]